MIRQDDFRAEERWAEAGDAGEKVRWGRMLVLGGGLAALNAVWMTSMEILWNQGYSTILSLYYNVVFTLTVLLVINAALKRWRPRTALTRSELLVLFVMAAIGTSIATLTAYLVSALAFPYRFGNLDSRWATDLLPYLPRSLTVSDPQAAKDYYLGNADLWRWASLKPWLLPFAGWGLFMLALVWTGICLSALTYNQWRRQERLAFPLNQIPIMMTEEKASFFRSGLFWVGFALAAGIDILNALNKLYPFVPGLPVKRQSLEILGMSRPWSALSFTYYSWNPFLIGLEYFLPLDLLFSLFFFYWTGRFQGLLLDFWGIEMGNAAEMVAPYMREQAFGALIALLVFALWVARGRWRESWERFQTILPLRRALWGSGAGAAAILAILVMAGMPFYVAAPFVIILLAVALSLARIRAQYGPPAAGLLLAAPGPVLYALMGRAGIGSQGLAGIALAHFAGREFCSHPMPPTLEGFALAEKRFSARRLIGAILLSALAGYAATFLTALVTGYSSGHGTAKVSGTQMYFGNEAYAVFSSRLSDPVAGPHADSLGAVGLGFGLTFLLQSLRTRFVAFPLHPVGYAIASSYSSTFIWSTALITWLVKLLILRYTGLKGYYRAAPLFLGLLLGEFIIGSLISLLGVLLHIPMYVFWPY
ncbi:MAG: hypothetical protein IT210_00930 [Armatimonadetes bacterium]|nr:hypothetical protein [Armatimonadota bacterium]